MINFFIPSEWHTNVFWFVTLWISHYWIFLHLFGKPIANYLANKQKTQKPFVSKSEYTLKFDYLQIIQNNKPIWSIVILFTLNQCSTLSKQYRIPQTQDSTLPPLVTIVRLVHIVTITVIFVCIFFELTCWSLKQKNIFSSPLHWFVYIIISSKQPLLCEMANATNNGWLVTLEKHSKVSLSPKAAFSCLVFAR